MFVKIKYWDVIDLDEKGYPLHRTLNREVIYDCHRASIGFVKPIPPEKDVMEGVLVIDIGSQEDRTITFLMHQTPIKEEIEILYMNDKGKTIDRHIYH